MSEPRTNCAPECVRGWHVEGCPNAPIPATLRHDAGAVARCSYCRRYTLDPAALSGGAETPRCDCGDSYGWSGSFEPPGPDAVWSHDYRVPAPPPGDGPRTLGRVEPVQGRIVVCGAGADDAPRPAPDDGRPMHFVCPGCGPHVAADEDGCCVQCGADCTGEPCGGHVCGTALEAAQAEAGRLRDAAEGLVESYDLAMGPESPLPAPVKEALRGLFLGVDDARAALAAAKGGPDPEADRAVGGVGVSALRRLLDVEPACPSCGSDPDVDCACDKRNV